jgi:hypothetical protein
LIAAGNIGMGLQVDVLIAAGNIGGLIVLFKKITDIVTTSDIRLTHNNRSLKVRFQDHFPAQYMYCES